MLKGLCFVIGVVLTSIGLAFSFLYLNLMTTGYSFPQFVNFIFRRGECLIFFLGVILILISFERRIRDELLLRYPNKFKRRKGF